MSQSYIDDLFDGYASQSVYSIQQNSVGKKVRMQLPHAVPVASCSTIGSWSICTSSRFSKPLAALMCAAIVLTEPFLFFCLTKDRVNVMSVCIHFGPNLALLPRVERCFWVRNGQVDVEHKTAFHAQTHAITTCNEERRSGENVLGEVPCAASKSS